MTWNHFKEKFEKVILYFTLSEREKRLYRKYMMDRSALEILTRKQKQALSIRLKVEFEYRKTICIFLIVSLFILVISGIWTMFFEFLTGRYMLFAKNIYMLEVNKILWIICIFFSIIVFPIMIVLVVIYIRNTYSIYKKLLLLEEIIEEEKKRNDKKRETFSS